MKKKIDIVLITSTLVCFLPTLLMLAFYQQLPQQVPVHWNASGTADNFLPKAVATFGLPAFFAIVNLIIHIGLNNDPKRANASARFKLFSKWLVPIVSIVAMSITLFTAIGVAVPVEIVVPCLLGVILIICGNYLPKCRQNYTVGIKLPWTLNDENNWNKTHRLAGYLWMAGGLLMVVSAVVSLLSLIPVILGVLVAVPVIYSYVLYQKSSHQNP